MVLKAPSLKARKRERATGTNPHGNKNQKPTVSYSHYWQGLSHRKFLPFPKVETLYMFPHMQTKAQMLRKERMNKKRQIEAFLNSFKQVVTETEKMEEATESDHLF